MPNAVKNLACLVFLSMASGISPSDLYAQAEEARSDPVFRVSEPKSQLKIVEKFSTIVEMKTKVRRVDGFDPSMVNVTALSPSRIRIQALDPGVTTIVLEDEDGKHWSVEVFVAGDVRHLQAHIRRLFPNASVEAVEVNDAVVLRGWVTHPEHITELVEVAQQFYPEVLNQIKVGGVQQVQLHVRVMEIQRTKVRRLGMNFLFVGNNGYLASTVGSLTPIESLSVAGGTVPSLSVSSNALGDPSITFGLVNANRVFQGFVDALKQEGLLKIMAQPSITTTNGRPASLLNGGEFPILVPAGLGTVGVEFREFGVRMEVVPIILGGGRLRLELQPEVSERDFANAISVQGVTVPGLTVRRANTQVEMGFGQTLMIAGLIARRHTAETDKLPLFGELPWIGAAFSRKRFEEVETELVILVTPEFVAPLKRADVPSGGPGSFTASPVDRELFFNQMIEVPNYGEPDVGDFTIPTTETHAPAAATYEQLPQENRPAEIPPVPSARSSIRRTRPSDVANPIGHGAIRQTSGTRVVRPTVPDNGRRRPNPFLQPTRPAPGIPQLQTPIRSARQPNSIVEKTESRQTKRSPRPSLIAPKPSAK